MKIARNGAISMYLHNVMEDKVTDLTANLMEEEKNFCSCNRCQLDVIALTLNRIKPKYVVTNKGELYSRAQMMTSQFDADIVKEITKSIDIERENPRHE